MRRRILPYKPYLKSYARRLRQNMTLSEVLLWRHLKGKQMRGFTFNRQRPIDQYIVDFYCKDLMLAIEVDGSSHNLTEVLQRDLKRQQVLESYGVRVLRYDDLDVKNRLEAVLQNISDWIEKNENELPGRISL